MPKVTVPQLNKVFECETNKNLMDLLIENEIPVASSCLGEGICSKCFIEVTPAKFDHSDLEKRTLERNKLTLNYRLSCQYSIQEDIEVKTTYW